MIEQLQKLESKLTDLVKFAEAKNAALITFNSACIFVLFDFFRDLNPGAIKTCFAILIIVLIISVLLCLFSLLSSIWIFCRLDKRLLKKVGDVEDSDNLLYFRDIVKYKPREYLKEIERIYGMDQSKEESKLRLLLSTQIVEISIIAYKKYRIFNVAAAITFIPFLMAIIGIIVA